LAKLQSDLREFIGLLNSHKVDYLVVGGHAVAFHGFPRYTGDIDFFLRPTSSNAVRVIQVLHEFGFSGLQVKPEDLTQPNQVVQLGQPPNRIDLLTSISGVDFDDAWRTRVSAEMDGQPVNFAGSDAIIKNKEASGLDKDLLDVRHLRIMAARKCID